MSSATHSTRILLAAALMAVSTLAAAQTPSPTLVFVSRNEKPEGVLGIMDPATGKVIDRVPIGIDPHGVAVSADGKLAFVANTNAHNKTKPDGDTISVIDLVARKELRKVDLGEGARPHDLRVAGGKVFFTAGGFKAIGRYDPVRDRLSYFGLGADGMHIIALTKDANTLFVSNNGSNTVTVVEGTASGPPQWKQTVIPVGKTPEGIDISADGKEVWVVNEASGDVSIIDVATKKVSQTVDIKTNHANRLHFTPDGKRVIILDREIGVVVVMDAATRQVVKRIKMSGGEGAESIGLGDVTIVPDSSRAYVNITTSQLAEARRVNGEHYIAEIDLKTMTVTRRFPTGDMSDSIAWVTRSRQ